MTKEERIGRDTGRIVAFPEVRTSEDKVAAVAPATAVALYELVVRGLDKGLNINTRDRSEGDRGTGTFCNEETDSDEALQGDDADRIHPIDALDDGVVRRRFHRPGPSSDVRQEVAEENVRLRPFERS